MPLYRMDPLEIACGWLADDHLRIPRQAADPRPRVALDTILLRCLAKPPCLVAFSGGRDSSALLAATVAVARREQLPLPVAVTLAYPDAPEADEDGWQQQVLDHVGVTERVRLVVHDEHDAVGPIAAPLLRRHGQIWPPNVTPTWRMMDQARGGSLLTGEGGDEIFGIKRITPLTKLLRHHVHADRRLYPLAAHALAPRPLRRRSALRGGYRPPWVREAAWREMERRHSDDLAAMRLHAGRQTRQVAGHRGSRIGYETVRALGTEIGVDYVQPFLEPGFVAATAAAAGFWGWTSRTSTMRRLFGDLLPRAVIDRQSKATFNAAVFAGPTREFARGWTGAGVDPDLVDIEVLRQNWLSPAPHAPSMALLHQAWLATAA
ncbi:asparagine synthase-related protein [Pseudonocardia saturnea]